MAQDWTKEGLARAFGDIAPADLVDRREAAAILEMAYTSLNPRAAEEVGFWKFGTARNAAAVYRRDWLALYKAWRAIPQAKRSPFKIEGVANAYGEQPWPEAPTRTRPISLGESMVVFDRWKYGELHRRVEAIFARPLSAEELLSLTERHVAERDLLLDEVGGARPYEEVRGAVEAKAAELILPGDVAERREDFASVKYAGDSLLHSVWLDVVRAEAGWLRTRTQLERSREP